MSIWILDQYSGELDYPTLGFRATTGDLLDAAAAPDPRWSLHSDQGAAETVERYTVGSDPSYVEPGDGHVLTWSDEDNAFVPTARPVFVAEDVDAATAANVANPASDTAAALTAQIAQLGVVSLADEAATDAFLAGLAPGTPYSIIQRDPFDMFVGVA